MHMEYSLSKVTLLMQFIANKAKDLVGYLKNLEKVSELVAAFWSSKADDFESKAGEMSENQVHTIDVMKEAVSQDGIEFWTKAKDEMDRYASAMSVINNSFNFLTEAKPDKEKPFHMSHLNLTLSVPSFVDID